MKNSILLEGLQDTHSDFEFARRQWDKLGLGVNFDDAYNAYYKKNYDPEHWDDWRDPVYSEEAWNELVQSASEENESLRRKQEKRFEDDLEEAWDNPTDYANYFLDNGSDINEIKATLNKDGHNSEDFLSSVLDLMDEFAYNNYEDDYETYGNSYSDEYEYADPDPEAYDTGHAEEWTDKHPYGYYNNEDDYGLDDDMDWEGYDESLDESDNSDLDSELENLLKSAREYVTVDVYDNYTIVYVIYEGEVIDKLEKEFKKKSSFTYNSGSNGSKSYITYYFDGLNGSPFSSIKVYNANPKTNMGYCKMNRSKKEPVRTFGCSIYESLTEGADGYLDDEDFENIRDEIYFDLDVNVEIDFDESDEYIDEAIRITPDESDPDLLDEIGEWCHDHIESVLNYEYTWTSISYNSDSVTVEVKKKVDESLNEGALSNGSYSLYNGWVKVPDKDSIPDEYPELEPELSELKDKADKCETIDEIDNFIDDLYKIRQNGLLTDGEYGKGNLLFKEIRNAGILDRLKEMKVEKQNQEMSLESLEEDYEYLFDRVLKLYDKDKTFRNKVDKWFKKNHPDIVDAESYIAKLDSHELLWMLTELGYNKIKNKFGISDESLTEDTGVSKADFIKAYIDAYGGTKKDAEKKWESESDSYKKELVKGFKGNAKKSFLNDSLKEDYPDASNYFVVGNHYKDSKGRNADFEYKGTQSRGWGDVYVFEPLNQNARELCIEMSDGDEEGYDGKYAYLGLDAIDDIFFGAYDESLNEKSGLDAIRKKYGKGTQSNVSNNNPTPVKKSKEKFATGLEGIRKIYGSADESLTEDSMGVRELVADYLLNLLSEKVLDNLAVVVGSKIPAYDPDWCSEVEHDDAYYEFVDSLVDDLFANAPIGESKEVKLNEAEIDDQRAGELAEYLDVPVEDINEVGDAYSPYLYEVNGEEYYVLTSDEAEEAAKQDVLSLADDMGLESFSNNYQETIVNNFVDEDFIMDMLQYEIDYYRDEEGDEETAEYLEDMDFTEAFNYIKDLYDEKSFKDLIKDHIDWNAVAEDVVSMDGPANSLARYDGKEIELGNYFAYRCN